MKKYLTIGCLLMSMGLASAHTHKVSTAEQMNNLAEELAPGDTLLMRNGTWKDAHIVLKRMHGTAAAPIVVIPETLGGASLEGTSSIRFSGDYIQVKGLKFVNGGLDKGYVIEFRTSKDDYANNSTVTECVVDDYNPAVKTNQSSYVSLWGKNNTVSNCYLAHKRNKGVTLVVWPENDRSDDNHHHIFHNYFGPRPALGSNGGETIRIGTSFVSKRNSRTLVEENLFDRCSGEVEIISIKSCENVIKNNTFVGCEGGLTLRHGDRNHVIGNIIDGQNRPGTGGIRIINAGHVVEDNLIIGTGGDGFRSALTVMNGIKNSPLNGYDQVVDVTVRHNTIFDCNAAIGLCVGAGERARDMMPKNLLMQQNLVYCPQGESLITTLQQGADIHWDRNMIEGPQGATAASVPAKLTFVKWHGYQLPVSDSVGVLDLMNKHYLTPSEVGASWYRKALMSNHPAVHHNMVLTAGKNVLYDAVKKAQCGDTITLKPGEYVNTKRIKINKRIMIRSLYGQTNSASDKKAILVFGGEKNTVVGFEIQGGRLTLQGLTLQGIYKDLQAKYAITTAKTACKNYILDIESCDFSHFSQTDGGAVFKAYPNSFADSIIVRNSSFVDNYRGFSINAEKDLKGRYNAEHVYIENCFFNEIQDFAVDYRRLGLDESTVGGTFVFTKCILRSVDHPKSLLHYQGIKKVRVDFIR